MSEDQERRITRRWSDDEAEYFYRLERWFPPGTRYDGAPREGYWSHSASGNREWALRHAAHYRIVVPENDE